jgi:tetratricopeptide (TPR) repeat protein
MGSSVSAVVHQNIQPLPFDSHTFPKYGVKLSYLPQFLVDCGGHDQLVGYTTTEVCEMFIKPLTMRTQSSYCDLLRHLHHPAVEVATVFISHAWKFQFLDVINAITTYFKNKSKLFRDGGETNQEDVVVWFDLFSNNQHKAIELEFEYWATTFRSAIKSFGFTVMVFSPWNDPIPLTRAWCLWELYCTVETDSIFDIAMTTSSKQQFLDDILGDTDSEINQMLGTINVERSQCFKPSDREMIFNSIQKSIGFSQLNGLVFEKLRAWVVSSLEEEMKTERGHMKDPKYLTALASLYQNQGVYDKAEVLLQECLALNEKEFGEKHVSTLRTMNSLASLFDDQGNYSKAQSLHQKCLALREELLGERHSDTLISLNCLASSYSNQLLYSQAESLLARCLRLRREVLGEKHLDTLTSMNNLGALYENQGNSLQAQRLYEECVSLSRELSGDRHPSTLVYLNNLAFLYESQGFLSQAQSLYEECLSLRREVLGDHHPNTLTSMNNLGSFYSTHGYFDQAEILYKECLVGRREILGQCHPKTIASINNLAGLYLSRGFLDLARPLYEECLLLCQSPQGKQQQSNARKGSGERGRASAGGGEQYHHTSISLIALESLAMIHNQQGNYSQAMECLESCLKRREELLGERHPETLRTMANLGTLCENLGLMPQAESLLVRCLRLRREVLGEKHLDTLTSMNNLGALYENQGNSLQAQRLYEECLSIQREVYGEKDLKTLGTMNQLALLLYYSTAAAADHDFTDTNKTLALKLLEECLTHRKELLGPSHAETLKSMNSLGILYGNLGQEEKAMSLFEECLRKQREVLGKNHVDTIATMENLIQLYRNQGQHHKADDLLRQGLQAGHSRN